MWGWFHWEEKMNWKVGNGKHLSILIGVAFIGISIWATAAPPQPWFDTDKHRADIMLWYDETSGDTSHTSGEALYWDDPHPPTWQADDSCWMASANNLILYAGLAGQYEDLILDGVSDDVTDPWDGGPGDHSGDMLTFDDCGVPDWVLMHVACEGCWAGPIFTKTFNGFWTGDEKDPISWCREKLEGGHPVSLGFRYPAPPPGSDGRYGFGQGCDGHVVTLWDITDTKLVITDSDDGDGDDVTTVECDYAWNAETKDWTLTYGGAAGNHINYAISRTPPTALDPSTWSLIKTRY